MGGMWTEARRARQLAFERGRRHPTGLTDAGWDAVQPFLPRPPPRGRPWEVGLREVLNAVRHLARTGCGWRMLPVHFGPWEAVRWWFRRLVRRLLFQTVHDLALVADRCRAGRDPGPSAAVLDGGGCDAAKRAKGRKRHIAVGTDGRLPMVNLTTADVQDAAGAEDIVKAMLQRWPWLKHLFAGGAYDRGRLADLAAYKGLTLEVVRKLADQKGFQALPRRWVVERTFGWMARWRRLVRDCEVRLDVSGAMIHVSMGALMLRRLAHPTT